MVIGSMGWVISPTYEWGINWGYNPFTNLGGGNSNMFWNVHPDLGGNDPIWLAYFSNGLKQPTRYGMIWDDNDYAFLVYMLWYWYDIHYQVDIITLYTICCICVFDNLDIDMNMFRTIWIIVHLIWLSLGFPQPVNDGECMAANDEARDGWLKTDNIENVILQKDVFFLFSARNGFLGVYAWKLGGCISQKLKNWH